jgi:hypothetical protein
MKKDKIGIVSTAETTTEKNTNDYLLRLEISQNCTYKKTITEKDGTKVTQTLQHNVSPYTMQIEYKQGVSIGKLIGVEIYNFFKLLQLQKDFKQVPFKLSQPINLKITYFVNGESYNIKTTNDIKLKFSGDYAPNKFAKFLFCSLLELTKTNRKELNAMDIFDDKNTFVLSETSINKPENKELIFKLCDSELSELKNLLVLN